MLMHRYPTDRGNLGMEAFAIALSHGYDGDRWYVSESNLQIACLDLCVVCRSLAMSQFLVKHDTPPRLWNRHKQEIFGKKHPASRIPILTARSILWQLPSSLISEGSKQVKERGRLHASFIRGLRHSEKSGMGEMKNWWPESLRKITFAPSFTDSIENIVWPTYLDRLVFGRYFNRPIEGLAWPSPLLHLAFGHCFNQPIDGVAWPTALRYLAFGDFFNQTVEGVVWPSSLKHLTFGAFGSAFNQPIADARWPASLEHLAFGSAFNQSIHQVFWPASLQYLGFGRNFNQPIFGVVWPASLKRLSLGSCFRQPTRDVVWPAGLQHLTVGPGSAQMFGEMALPSSLHSLTLGTSLDGSIQAAVWCAPPQGVPITLTITELVQLPSCNGTVFWVNCQRPICKVVWPASLNHLSVGLLFGRRPRV